MDHDNPKQNSPRMNDVSGMASPEICVLAILFSARAPKLR